jgi:uncharacterized protein YbjT (DUF2867 family)
MHKEIEEYLEKSGLAWTQLRPTGFMQETPSIIQDGAFSLALGYVSLNPIDVVDVAKVRFFLLRDGGHEGARLEHRTRNSLAAITSYFVLSRQVLNCLKDFPQMPCSVPVRTDPCCRVG